MRTEKEEDQLEESLSDWKARLQERPTVGDTTADVIFPGHDMDGPCATPKWTQSRPLIEQVSNKWRDEKQEASLEEEGCLGGLCDVDEETSCPELTRDVISSRRFRKLAAIVILFSIALYYAWTRLIQPQLEEEWALKEGFLRQSNGTYGVARGGDIDKNLVRIRDLDPHLLPGGQADPHGERRLVFVGDVHGCRDELVRLLNEVGFRKKTDHLILVGDVISKGPDDIGVLDELIHLGATSVRGNHEDRLLTMAESVNAHHSPTNAAATSFGFAQDDALLRELKPKHLRFLRDMPLMLHIPPLPMAAGTSSKAKSPIKESIIVVHAGLAPGVALEKQDPYLLMNMRSINRKTHVPSASPSGENRGFRPWFDIWAWYNDRLFRGHSLKGFNTPEAADDEAPEITTLLKFSRFFGGNASMQRSRPKPQVVVYGHNSRAGLQIKRWSKGLDSACVAGGELTALVLDARGKQKLFSVECEDNRE